LGYTEAAIAQEIGVSTRTVRRDLRSALAEEFVDELKRRQFQDIEEAKNTHTRLYFRDRILDKLIPRRINTKIEQGKSPIIIELWQPKTKEEQNNETDSSSN
jgi:hypothetical protein